jgi:hypothetical protein
VSACLVVDKLVLISVYEKGTSCHHHIAQFYTIDSYETKTRFQQYYYMLPEIVRKYLLLIDCMSYCRKRVSEQDQRSNCVFSKEMRSQEVFSLRSLKVVVSPNLVVCMSVHEAIKDKKSNLFQLIN